MNKNKRVRAQVHLNFKPEDFKAVAAACDEVRKILNLNLSNNEILTKVLLDWSVSGGAEFFKSMLRQP